MILWISTALFFILSWIFLYEFIRYRRRLYASKRKLPKLPVPLPAVGLDSVHPCFASGDFGHSIDCEVSIVHRTRDLPGATSDHEAWILSVLAKHATHIFEFGTCTGKTTYHLARNSPRDARIVTLTLAPDQVGEYDGAASDSPDAARFARIESAYRKFLYTGTDVEPKITQLYGDSKKFDETPYRAAFDMIFIDGSHAYSYVENDTGKAFAMLKPGGIILWHDYRWDDPSTVDVFRFLNELAAKKPIRYIRDSSLVFFRELTE
ncbi:MAG: class I SAM-dependent methyltransferase [Chitinispirillaceae bacterium]|nr:class I SAM-dependent methyltransferase [Chitinispirillaceae bacterium]